MKNHTEIIGISTENEGGIIEESPDKGSKALAKKMPEARSIATKIAFLAMLTAAGLTGTTAVAKRGKTTIETGEGTEGETGGDDKGETEEGTEEGTEGGTEGETGEGTEGETEGETREGTEGEKEGETEGKTQEGQSSTQEIDKSRKSILDTLYGSKKALERDEQVKIPKLYELMKEVNKYYIEKGEEFNGPLFPKDLHRKINRFFRGGFGQGISFEESWQNLSEGEKRKVEALLWKELIMLTLEAGIETNFDIESLIKTWSTEQGIAVLRAFREMIFMNEKIDNLNEEIDDLKKAINAIQGHNHSTGTDIVK